MTPSAQRQSEILRGYFRAKDENRPHLLDDVFAADARLEVIDRAMVVVLPAAAVGRDAIADALVRRFNQTYENIYSFYLARPGASAATFGCGWVVFMTTKADRAVRAGAGRYDWRFTMGEPFLAEALTITIETMVQLDGAAWPVVHRWLGALAYPWTTAGDALAAAADVAELEPLRRCIEELGATAITPPGRSP